jgi:hypothetical protein
MTQDGSEMLRQKNAGAAAIARTALPLSPRMLLMTGAISRTNYLRAKISSIRWMS